MASNDIRDLTPFLQRIFFNQRAWYTKHFPQRRLILTCTYRDKDEQAFVYESGRLRPGPILTYCDGTRNKSMHNYLPERLGGTGARAYDFAVLINNKARWDEKYYNSCWLFFREAKLTGKVKWGRDFKSSTGKPLKDFPHIQEI